MLPPRANGALALLEGSPTADVVICANTGLEPFGSLAEIRASLVADRPIVIETWRVPRCDIPTDPDEFALWLFDEFEKINTWVTTQLNEAH